jgi:hypothetical protein
MEPNKISLLLIPCKQKDFRGSLKYHLVEYVQTEWNLIASEVYRWQQLLRTA